MELLLLPESIQKDHSHTDEVVLSDMEKDVSLLVEAVGLHCNTAAGLCKYYCVMCCSFLSCVCVCVCVCPLSYRKSIRN